MMSDMRRWKRKGYSPEFQVGIRRDEQQQTYTAPAYPRRKSKKKQSEEQQYTQPDEGSIQVVI